MANWDDIILQLTNGQQALHNTLQQYIAMQARGGAAHPKKVVLAPEIYDRLPQKFHEWWLKTKVWVATTHATATDREKAAVVFSHLEGPHAGYYAQVCLNECMAANAWPTWADLQTKIEGFFLPRNNREWARSQLLCLHQGPHQRIDNFLAQFQALKLQSECPDEYAKDLLERVVTRKVLEQVYIQGLDRTTWVCLTQAIRTVGRAQELFLINMATPTWYFSTNNYTSSLGIPHQAVVHLWISVPQTLVPNMAREFSATIARASAIFPTSAHSLDEPGNKGHNKDGLYSPR